MNRKVVALVLVTTLFFLTLSLAIAILTVYSRVPQVVVTSPSQRARLATPEEEALSRKEFDEMFADDTSPKTQALPASAVNRP